MSNTNQVAMRVISRSASTSATDAWRQVDPDRVAVSWTARLPLVVGALTVAQVGAAALAGPYVAQIAGQSGSHVLASAFGGVASDGRPLASLLFQPAIAVLAALSRGAKPASALAGGLAVLDMIVRTQVADANRLATGVAITAHPDVIGHERVVRTPACKRCIVLAGRVYRWSEGFKRHPRCDCTMQPVTREQHRGKDLDNHPRALFDRMTVEQQDKNFGIVDAKAIRDGADISQVVNSRKGMSTAAGSQPGLRPTPEQIYRTAGTRERAVELLRKYGYIL
ncbi:MAG: hypothetical protein ACRDQH_18200 [Pseudonocardiaceae bacterium]